jgi:uncharacterized protein with GYD domain
MPGMRRIMPHTLDYLASHPETRRRYQQTWLLAELSVRSARDYFLELGVTCAFFVGVHAQKETIMSIYMYQASYTSEAWHAQVKNPRNRIEQVRPMIEGQGGRILGAYYAFGEYDVVLIVEAPDHVSMSALALAAAAGGAIKTAKTTVLMSIEDGIEAMRRASGAGYRPPGN